ncbi:YcgJ family protein [Brucella tritici]|uniref:Uncharacterized protein n=1 Tax=Brucella tritici TaxID=94626 RepID=A0A6L3YMG7_9HYPH|nr:YcgJ family protein [Brucella tritici]KAB2684185.1 hypothetical protein F9L08_14280 [Brucella tritici]
MKITLPILLAVSACGISSHAFADQASVLNTPANGVLCDQYFCADEYGISNGLTAQYLGQSAADKLASQGDFDRTKFTFSNGIFCDVSERRCREDRYTDPKTGKRSRVSLKYTADLFGGALLRFRRPHQ